LQIAVLALGAGALSAETPVKYARVYGSVVTPGGDYASITSFHKTPINVGTPITTGVEISDGRVKLSSNGGQFVREGQLIAQVRRLGSGPVGMPIATPVSEPEIPKQPTAPDMAPVMLVEKTPAAAKAAKMALIVGAPVILDHTEALAKASDEAASVMLAKAELAGEKTAS